MKSRPIVLAISLAAALAAGPRARAEDVPDDVKEQIAYFEKYVGKAKDDGKFADLVHELAVSGHPAAAARIGKILTNDKNPEHQLIAADALGDFKKEPGRAAAGKALVEALARTDLDEEGQIAVIDALGRLPYVPGCQPVCDLLLKSSYPWLMLRCVRSLGEMKDLHALPALLEILERFPAGYTYGDTSGKETRVDTGASGDADQKAAEKAYNDAHKGDRRKAGKPVMFRAYVQELRATIEKITNDPTINGAKALRAWMEAHIELLKSLGIEIPKYKGPSQDEADPKKADDPKKK